MKFHIKWLHGLKCKAFNQFTGAAGVKLWRKPEKYIAANKKQPSGFCGIAGFLRLLTAKKSRMQRA
jgi:hypothetical protein